MGKRVDPLFANKIPSSPLLRSLMSGNMSSIYRTLLSVLALFSTLNLAGARHFFRRDHTGSLPPYLLSQWHIDELGPSKLNPKDAMAYYFPHLHQNWNRSYWQPGLGLPGNGSSGGNGGGGCPTCPTCPTPPPPSNYSLRNFNTIQSVYNLTVYPKNLPLFYNDTGIGLPFFNENVTGRVTPLGNFSGYEDNIEYFWGLAPVPVAPSTAAISQAAVTHFTSGCPEVAASTVELTVTNVNGTEVGEYITKLKEIAFWRFDDDGRVIAYDAWIPNLSDFVAKVMDPWIQIYPGGTLVPNATEKLQVEEQICGQQDIFCTGGNAVYSSVPECVATLAQKPFGTYDETWGDNVVCRRIHVLLTALRPAVSPYPSSTT